MNGNLEALGEPRRRLGRLKIFLGLGPGVGKTAMMLKAAERERALGKVVVTLRGTEAVEGREENEGEELTGASSIEAIFARRPDVVLVDGLGGRNPEGSRNERRYRDALVLVEAGIDVWGTLNVYEIASRTEAFWKMTGVARRDAAPDSLLDNADVVLVDMAPAMLRQRLERGQFRPPRELAPERSGFFEEVNLLELREASARLFAERVAREAQQRRRPGEPARASHRLLTAIEFGWEAQPLILLTRRLAGSLNAPWIVLCIETKAGDSEKARRGAARALELARELGAEVITMADDDFVEAVLRVAAARNITQIVTAKTEEEAWWRRLFSGEPPFVRLARRSAGIDVHVASLARRPRKSALAALGTPKGKGWQWWAALGATAAVMAGGFLIQPLMPPAAASLSSLLFVVGVAAFLERGPALLATGLIAAGWDYFFLPPYFHFSIARSEDKVLVAMYFTVALILGQFSARIRSAETAERQREERATALYLLTRGLAEATTAEEIVENVAGEMERCFAAQTAVLLPDETNRLKLQPGSTLRPGENDLAAAAWALERRQWAGRFTGNLPLLDTMFLPLESSRRLVGVLGARLQRSEPLSLHERNLLEAMARQAAVALDRQHLRELSEKAEVIAASERLGKTLLDSVSHEMRTPLAAIRAAATELAEVGQVSAAGRVSLTDIQDASERLNQLVGNVLDITRLESGHVKPLVNECEVAEIVHVAIAEMGDRLARHPLKVELDANLPLIRTDFVFFQQALMNLLANAAVHTPKGTPVDLCVRRTGDMLAVTVADRGPGIDPRQVPRVFDKFYRGPEAPTGGIGLGLSLVKGFVKAIGGDVTARNREGGGAEFIIRLPLSRTLHLKAVSI